VKRRLLNKRSIPLQNISFNWIIEEYARFDKCGKWNCDARTGFMCKLVEIKLKKDKNLNEAAEFATIFYEN
jgi:hypothetical protein